MTKRDNQAKRREDERRREECLDEALADSFPTSDPPSHSNPSQGTRRDADHARQDKRDKTR
jgi:hypothetical protein